MQFNTPFFLFLFLPVFVLVYHLAGGRSRLLVGVLGSLLFYAWGNLDYLPIFIGLTLAAYGLGRLLNGTESRKLRATWLWLGLLGGVALIAVFKLTTRLAYPLGLSYMTFQALSYLLEVHQKRVAAANDLLSFSFYLALFPKIPVGPIVRYSTVKDQIGDLHTDPVEMADGLRRFIRGLAKKVLIADAMGRLVNPIFALGDPLIAPAWAWLVLLSYTLQLFFDFSGYTDMAIGIGHVLGLTFPENFNFPYLARSISDFWRRWHISLAVWFRDFVFYPLERRRLKWIGQPLNTLIVFLLVGLWHGLSLNFVIWGLLHGSVLVFESTPAGKWLTRCAAPLPHIYALGVILTGWVFFRAPTTHFALSFFHRLVGYTGGLTPLPFGITQPLPFVDPTFIIALVAGLVFCFPIGKWLQSSSEWLLARQPAVRFPAQVVYDLGMVAVMFLSLASMTSAAFSPGIYGAF